MSNTLNELKQTLQTLIDALSKEDLSAYDDRLVRKLDHMRGVELREEKEAAVVRACNAANDYLRSTEAVQKSQLEGLELHKKKLRLEISKLEAETCAKQAKQE